MWPQCRFFSTSTAKPSSIDVEGARAASPTASPAPLALSAFSPVDVTPHEVWALVFEFLTLRDLRRSAALVCRVWRAVATDQRTVARLFWRRYRDQRRDRDHRPTSPYGPSSQLRDRASGASALPSPPEIIHLHLGQAGCELGSRYWERVCGEVGVRASDGGLAPSGESHHHQWTPLHSHFRDACGAHGGRFVPRAVLVDYPSLGSVLGTTNAERLRSLVSPDNYLVVEGEAGEQRSRMVEVVRKELERADLADGFLLFLQLGEMGDMERELVRACVEEWPDITSAAAVVVPPIDSLSDLACWDIARTLHYVNDFASMAVLLDGTPPPSNNLATTYDVLADALAGATHPVRFGRTAAMGAAIYSLRRMATELLPFPFPRLLSLSHVPIVATRPHEPTATSTIADVVTRLLRHRASCLSGDAPLGHRNSVCQAAYATFHTNPAAGRQKYGEVEAAVREEVGPEERRYGVLASVSSSAPFGGPTQSIALRGDDEGHHRHWVSGSMLSNSSGSLALVSPLVGRLRPQGRQQETAVSLEDAETLSYLDDVVEQWNYYRKGPMAEDEREDEDDTSPSATKV